MTEDVNFPEGLRVEEHIFRGHRIELQIEEGAVPFSAEHLSQLDFVLEKYWSIDPDLVRRYSFIRSINQPNTTWYSNFPQNGRNIQTLDGRVGFALTNRGMSLTEPSRISSATKKGEDGFVSNFSGVCAHELVHGGNSVHGIILFPLPFVNAQFIAEWLRKFRWKKNEVVDGSYKTYTPVIVKEDGSWFPDGVSWSSDPEPDPGWVLTEEGHWQKGDYIVYPADGHWTAYPERCIGGKNSYASSTFYKEDIADSVAAYLLNPGVLDTEKRELIDKRVREY